MLVKDIRYALRGLRRSTGFATAAILCLGFGIGLNTTLFSVIDGVLLKPYPYPDPDRILVVGSRHAKTGNTAGLSYLDMRDWQEARDAFTTIAAVASRSLTVSDGGGEPERYLGAGISWDLFPMLGTPPVLGRGFSPDDDRSGGGGVVLLSHDLWTRRYLADPAVLGRTILVNARPHVVIGVMPPRFTFPTNHLLWVPLTPMTGQDPRDARGLFAFGRLAPGVTREQAAQQLDAVAARLAALHPLTSEGWTSDLVTLRERFLPPEVPIVLYLMMAAATLVLFIACSNVANLLLARATARRREIALRTALGASRTGIVRQLLTEAVVLNLVSVPPGVLLAEIGTRLIAAAMPPDQVPYYVTWDMDWRALAYTVAIAATTALIFGVFPALQVSRGNLHDALKEGTRGNSGARSRLRSVLVVAQVSLALVSLVGALLFVRTFGNLDTANVGFDTRPIMTMRFYMAGDHYDQPDARLRRAEDVVRRVAAQPGVLGLFASNLVPFTGGGGGGPILVDGRPAQPGEEPTVTMIGVTPGFANALGLSLLRGRNFSDAEGYSRTPVALVNQTMAARFWPDTDAVGRRFRVTTIDTGGDWFTVIGVVPDANLFGVNPANETPRAVGFMPYAYQQALNTGLTIRVAGDPAAITSAVRTAIRASDPNLAVAMVRTLEDARRLTFWQYGLYGWIFGTIGAVGLLLAAVGVYGVLAYAVTQRTQEIGVRVALGASRRDVIGLVVRQGMWLAGIGIVVGLMLAPPAMWAARELLFRVSPFDPLSFAAVAVLLVAVAFVASYLPARRTLRVDPLTALRAE